MRRLCRAVLPSSRRSYVLAALLLHLLMAGALLYVGSRVSLPSSPPPLVVVELLPAVEIAPASPPAPVPAEPVSTDAAPPPLMPPAPPPSEVLPPTVNGAAAAAATAADGAAEPLPPADAALSQALPPPSAAVLPPRTVPSTPVADARQQWELQVLQYLDQHKRYPAMAQFLGQEDHVSVQLQVARDGTVLAQRIVSSRGYRRLDEAVVDLIGRANPLPPPPQALTERELEFRVTIAFSIEERPAQPY